MTKHVPTPNKWGTAYGHVAMRLRAARELKNLTQENVADMIGLTFQQLQKYEKGTNRISAGRLFQLAQIYEQPVAWFFVGLEPNGLAGTEGRDIAVELLVTPYGAEIARDFIALGLDDRRLVTTIAARLRNGPKQP